MRNAVILSRRLLTHPLLWLLVLAGAMVWRLERAGRLVAERVPDSGGYLRLAGAERLEQVLGSTRTYGYSLFLKPVLATGGEAWVPAAQLGFFVLAILLFWCAVSGYANDRWLAFFAAAPLFWAPILLHVKHIQAELVAASLGLASVAALLLLARRPASAWRWLLVVLAVTAAYQTRPAYLYLLPMAPVLALVLRRMLPAGRWHLRWAAGLALAVALPLVAYSGLRLAVMGHFGLVSFGGYNIAGVASGMIDERLVAELPAGAQRELAREILERRREAGLEPVTSATPIRVRHAQYNRNVWQIAVPAAREVGERLAAAAPEPSAEEPLAASRPPSAEPSRPIAKPMRSPAEREARAERRRERRAAMSPEELAERRQRRRERRERRKTEGESTMAVPVSPGAATPAQAGEREKRSGSSSPRAGSRKDPASARHPVHVNEALTELSREVLRRRPRLYLEWMLGGFAVGVGKTFELAAVRWTALALLAAVIAGALARRLRRRSAAPLPGLGWRGSALLVAAVLYAAASLGLVVLVEVPFDRYIVAGALLLPSASCAALFELLRGRGGGRVRAPVQSGEPAVERTR